MSLHSDDFETSDRDETRELDRRHPASFGHRHGLKIMGGVLAALLASVIAAQVAC